LRRCLTWAIGDNVEKTTDGHENGVVVAVFETVDGYFRYFVDTEGAARFSLSLRKIWPFTGRADGARQGGWNFQRLRANPEASLCLAGSGLVLFQAGAHFVAGSDVL
jgi:hypothetical protein